MGPRVDTGRDPAAGKGSVPKADTAPHLPPAQGMSLRRQKLTKGKAMLQKSSTPSANDTDLHGVLACFAKKSQPDLFFFFPGANCPL